MELNGIDLAGLAHEASKVEFPDVVKGRVCHIDADFLAYQTSYEKQDDPKTWEEMKHNAEIATKTIQALAAAEYLHLHLTPATSNKGGRFEQALLKPYQGNRVDKAKPRYLHMMREFLVQRFPGTLHQNCEADDGMSSAQYKAIKEGNRNLSIIASKDKDLSMVPGLHLDWDTGNIRGTETDFGYIEYNDDKKKVQGLGQKFFWAQMLMGDTADNIQGLPLLGQKGRFMFDMPGSLDFMYKKMKQLKEAGIPDEAMEQKVVKEIKALKPKKVGPKMAITILENVKSNKQAFNLVKALYQDCPTFTHHATGEPVEWNKAFLSEAQLLWMRIRKDDPLCVVKWWREING